MYRESFEGGLTKSEARASGAGLGALPPMSAKLPDDKLGVTRLQPHIHDVRAMSVCAPTADVSLQRGR